jgi:hypothetical protein
MIYVSGPVKALLAAKFWIPLSRINYVAFIMHYTIIKIFVYNIEAPIHYTVFTLVSRRSLGSFSYEYKYDYTIFVIRIRLHILTRSPYAANAIQMGEGVENKALGFFNVSSGFGPPSLHSVRQDPFWQELDLAFGFRVLVQERKYLIELHIRRTFNIFSDCLQYQRFPNQLSMHMHVARNMTCMP